MNTELIAEFLCERLQTIEQMQTAASVIGVSLATMYRYRAHPEGMPLGKLSKLATHLGLPLAGTAQWSRTSRIQSEQRRLDLESKITTAQGVRYVVTPGFTVNCEVPEFTSVIWRSDYPMASEEEFQSYLRMRQKRRSLYADGRYRSFELIAASCYRDFFNRRGRFRGISDSVWNAQHRAVIETASRPHVHRRVYLRNTPELPVFSCYSNNAALIRIDDFTVEFAGAEIVLELIDIFKGYFDSAEVKTTAELRRFLEQPN